MDSGLFTLTAYPQKRKLINSHSECNSVNNSDSNDNFIPINSKEKRYRAESASFTYGNNSIQVINESIEECYDDEDEEEEVFI